MRKINIKVRKAQVGIILLFLCMLEKTPPVYTIMVCSVWIEGRFSSKTVVLNHFWASAPLPII